MRKKYFKPFNRFIFLLLCILPLFANAGIFGGGDLSSNGKGTWYFGTQTEDILNFGFFVGNNQYEINAKSSVQRYMAGGVGYRRYGAWTTNILLGLENSRVSDAGQMGNQGRRFFGLYTQLSAMKFSGDKNIEYLLSYSGNSGQVWSRIRLKYYTSNGFLVGPEFVALRFLDYTSQDFGLVVEKGEFPYTITTKLGARNQDAVITSYAGVEFYRAF